VQVKRQFEATDGSNFGLNPFYMETRKTAPTMLLLTAPETCSFVYNFVISSTLANCIP